MKITYDAGPKIRPVQIAYNTWVILTKIAHLFAEYSSTLLPFRYMIDLLYVTNSTQPCKGKFETTN